MKFNFLALFKNGFPQVGLPNPIENKEFRDALLKALSSLNEKEKTDAEAKDGFGFSEKEYKRQLELLDAAWAADATKNRAANWILTAWEKGYIKSNVK
jgi:hypothetical protein